MLTIRDANNLSSRCERIEQQIRTRTLQQDMPHTTYIVAVPYNARSCCLDYSVRIDVRRRAGAAEAVAGQTRDVPGEDLKQQTQGSAFRPSNDVVDPVIRRVTVHWYSGTLLLMQPAGKSLSGVILDAAINRHSNVVEPLSGE